MANTTYTDNSTVITADTMNDLNRLHYTILSDPADAAAVRTALGLVIGTNVQAYGATLTTIEALALAQGDLLYATGADTITRLAKGTALQQLRMNAGATAPEWAASSSGAVLQVAYAELATSGTTTNLIPADDTIPQNTEGLEILTCSITPQVATSNLLIQVCANLSEDTNTTDGSVLAAIFRDTTASAISAQIAGSQASGGVLSALSHGEFSFQFRVASVATTLTTFKLHVGGENAGTYRWNGAGTRRLGGVYLTTMTITEISA